MSKLSHSIDRFSSFALTDREMYQLKGLANSHYQKDGFVSHSSLFEQSYYHLRELYQGPEQPFRPAGSLLGRSARSVIQKIQSFWQGGR